MSQKNIATANAYYEAMGQKNLSALEKLLHPEVKLITPLTKLTGKEAVFDSVKKFIPFFNTLTIHATFGEGERVMLAYDVDFPAPVGGFRTAVLFTFKDGLIFQYELLFDASPFKK